MTVTAIVKIVFVNNLIPEKKRKKKREVAWKEKIFGSEYKIHLSLWIKCMRQSKDL